MSKRYQPLAMAALTSAIFLAGCQEITSHFTSSQKSSDPQESAINKAPAEVDIDPSTLTWTTPTVIDVPIQISSRVTIKASQQISIRPQVSGAIVEQYVTSGDRVEKGDPLFKIDDAEWLAKLPQLRAALTTAEQSLISAEREYKRSRSLSDIHAVSQEQLESAETTYEIAKAEVDRARAAVEEIQIQVDRSLITAPWSGSVGIVDSHVGTLVTAQQAEPLATLVNNEQLKATGSLNSHFASWLLRGIGTGHLAPAQQDMASVGSVYHHRDFAFGYYGYPQLDREDASAPVASMTWQNHFSLETGSREYELNIDNHDHLFIANQAARAHLTPAYIPGAILLPSKSVLDLAEGKGSMIIVQNDELYPEAVMLEKAILLDDITSSPLGIDNIWAPQLNPEIKLLSDPSAQLSPQYIQQLQASAIEAGASKGEQGASQ